ncbi:unnamed protein product [Musa acuminata subsp. malaccensis]|uniref:(wild Malaysian banana) hypothetical protein n=1 Tax=Musa acuminata subsp. malaccensis TaxID=214687 RepID=A0A8D7F0Y3_MUSAM|nr:unnamed protein product [Musa acuminata subsp. malaccensis]
MRRPREAVLRMLRTLAAAAATATNAETSNCSDKCGQVLVQYPFGIEPGCYRVGFAITCDRSDGNSPKAFLGTSDIEVTEISLLHGQSRVKAQVSWECYNETAVESTNSNLPSKSFDVNGVYKISDDRNKFTLIGCNSMAYLQSQQTADGPYPYVYYTGCLSYCEDTSKVINGVCNGIGCCQTSIPSGLSDTSFSFTAYSHRYFLSFSPCSYVFIVDQDYYSFSATDLTMDTNKSMPLWLDWAVRDAATCEEAKGSDNYACRSQNSVCSKARSGAALPPTAKPLDDIPKAIVPLDDTSKVLELQHCRTNFYCSSSSNERWHHPYHFDDSKEQHYYTRHNCKGSPV